MPKGTSSTDNPSQSRDGCDYFVQRYAGDPRSSVRSTGSTPSPRAWCRIDCSAARRVKQLGYGTQGG